MTSHFIFNHIINLTDIETFIDGNSSYARQSIISKQQVAGRYILQLANEEYFEYSANNAA